MPTYREDWAFRLLIITLIVISIEYNGAYNLVLRSSVRKIVSLFSIPELNGWMISEEGYEETKFLDMLKLRASWGRVGDDARSLP